MAFNAAVHDSLVKNISKRFTEDLIYHAWLFDARSFFHVRILTMNLVVSCIGLFCIYFVEHFTLLFPGNKLHDSEKLDF